MESVVQAGSLCVISPHLDDAVFSCGALMASHSDVTVLTVFAGVPTRTDVTDYDRACGFGSGQAAMAARLAEDDRALALLGAAAIRMPCLDSQYAALPEASMLATALAAELYRIDAETVLMPLGLFHSDHQCVAEACLSLSLQSDQARWLAYEDCVHRRRAGVLQSRLATLYAQGIEATPVTLIAESPMHTLDMLVPIGRRSAVSEASAEIVERKSQAVQCYVSQLDVLGMRAGGDDCLPERYWLLQPLTPT